MSRAEAVRVLGMSVRFGNAAVQPLTEGLGSSKAFLRHGCALALALLRTEDGTQSVIDLLLGEPTEIWREVARALGQVGPPALMPLASNYGRLGSRVTPAATERVAWAMAQSAYAAARRDRADGAQPERRRTCRETGARAVVVGGERPHGSGRQGGHRQRAPPAVLRSGGTGNSVQGSPLVDLKRLAR